MRRVFNLITLLSASSASYASEIFNLPEGVTPVSHEIYHLHMLIFWVCVGIGIVVFGALFYALINHRYTPGRVAAQFHEHLWVEIAWTIIPFIILVLMAIPATITLINIRDTSRPDLTIKITGYQWKWRYDYLEQKIGFFSNLKTPFTQIHNQAPKDSHYLQQVDNPVIIPIHKKIRFLVTANDVIHSWWVPYFGVKQDAIPGFINEAWTQVNRPGIYFGQCAELCGINHAYMPIVVYAVTEDDFAKWILAKQTGTAPPPSVSGVAPSPSANAPGQPAATTSAPPKALSKEELMQKGEQVYLNTCAVCHQANGAGMPPTFPAIKGSQIALGPLPAHINIVLHGKPGTAMQAFKDQLSDEDLAAVITYERNAFGNNTNIVVQAAEIAAAKK